jgi:hypothetical protein
MLIQYFDKLPEELVTHIISFTDVSGIMGLQQTNLKIQKLASDYLREVKSFYFSLIKLQQNYCYKYTEDINLDNTYKEKVFTGKLVKKIVNRTYTHCLELEQFMLDKEKYKLFEWLELARNCQYYDKDPEVRQNVFNVILKLAKDNEPKDFFVIPIFGKSYSKEIPPPHKNAFYSSIYVTVSPIQTISLKIKGGSTISKELKKKITKSVEYANIYYTKISEPENRSELEETINIDALMMHI